MFEAHSHHRDPIEAKLQSKPSPGLRPPSPGGRGTKSLLPPGEGAAQRRMRGVSASATTTPHPAFGSADAKLALTAKLADNASSRFCFSYRRAARLEERRLPPSEYRPFCRNPLPMPVPSVTKPDHPKRQHRRIRSPRDARPLPPHQPPPLHPDRRGKPAGKGVVMDQSVPHGTFRLTTRASGPSLRSNAPAMRRASSSRSTPSLLAHNVTQTCSDGSVKRLR